MTPNRGEKKKKNTKACQPPKSSQNYSTGLSAAFTFQAKFTSTADATELLIEESYNSHHSTEILLSGSTIDTFETRAERVTLNHAISVVSNLLGKDLHISSNRPLPIHLHSHEISKFLDTETQFLLNKCCQSASLFNLNSGKR